MWFEDVLERWWWNE